MSKPITLTSIIAISHVLRLALNERELTESAIHVIYGPLCCGTTTALHDAAAIIQGKVVSLNKANAPICLVDDIHGNLRECLCELAFAKQRPEILAAAKAPVFSLTDENQQLLTRLIQWSTDEWKEPLVEVPFDLNLRDEISAALKDQKALEDYFSGAVSQLESDAEGDPVLDELIYPFALILATAFCLDEIIQDEDDPDSCSVEVYRIITNKMEEIRSLAAGL